MIIPTAFFKVHSCIHEYNRLTQKTCKISPGGSPSTKNIPPNLIVVGWPPPPKLSKLCKLIVPAAFFTLDLRSIDNRINPLNKSVSGTAFGSPFHNFWSLTWVWVSFMSLGLFFMFGSLFWDLGLFFAFGSLFLGRVSFPPPPHTVIAVRQTRESTLPSLM